MDENPGLVVLVTIVLEPIAAESRSEGAAEDKEQAGPGDHDEDEDDVSGAECLCLQHAAVLNSHFYYSRQERENWAESKSPRVISLSTQLWYNCRTQSENFSHAVQIHSYCLSTTFIISNNK